MSLQVFYSFTTPSPKGQYQVQPQDLKEWAAVLEDLRLALLSRIAHRQGKGECVCHLLKALHLVREAMNHQHFALAR